MQKFAAWMQIPSPSAMDEQPGLVARAALRLTAWTERWIPDAFIFALLATVLVFVAALDLDAVITAAGRRCVGQRLLGPDPVHAADVADHHHRPRAGDLGADGTRDPRDRGVAATPRGAVALVTFFALFTSWFNWGFSLIFSAVLAREVARRVEGVDYRALAAASMLGLGSIWAQGLSGSAALQMATPGALQPQIRDIVAAGGLVPGGIIPFRHTIFLWQSLVSVLVEIVVVVARDVARHAAGRRRRRPRRCSASISARASCDSRPRPAGPHPARRVARAFADPEPARSSRWAPSTSSRYFSRAPEPLNALTLNIINFTFLMVGVLLHRTPARLMHAVQAATPAVWGVILQFPFYAGIAAIITTTHLNERLANAFVSISTPADFPAVVAIYSAVLGVFVPSGGSKWVIEAPYVMAAAHELKVHLGWVVASYDLGEALANLLQPFWMLPTLGMFGLRARDVMGYTFIVVLGARARGAVAGDVARRDAAAIRCKQR